MLPRSDVHRGRCYWSMNRTQIRVSFVDSTGCSVPFMEFDKCLPFSNVQFRGLNRVRHAKEGQKRNWIACCMIGCMRSVANRFVVFCAFAHYETNWLNKRFIHTALSYSDFNDPPILSG